MPNPPRWSPQETAVVARFGRAVLERRYASVAEAAPDLHREQMKRRRTHPETFAARTLAATRAKLVKYSRIHGRQVTRHFRWSPQEQRIIDTYARAVVRGKFRNAVEATDEYFVEMRALRRRYPDARWLTKERARGSVYVRLNARARKLGRRAIWVPWNAHERRLVERYARRVIRGDLNIMQAAREFRRMTDERRAKYQELSRFRVRRNLSVIHNMIWERTRELGRPRITGIWTAPEVAILKRYARDLVAGRFRFAPAAARACFPEIQAIQRRHPDAPWAEIPRNEQGVKVKISELAHGMAESWVGCEWSAREQAILGRYARDVVRGRFSSVAEGSRACLREFRKRHGGTCAGSPMLRAWRSPGPESRSRRRCARPHSNSDDPSDTGAGPAGNLRLPAGGLDILGISRAGLQRSVVRRSRPNCTPSSNSRVSVAARRVAGGSWRTCAGVCVVRSTARAPELSDGQGTELVTGRRAGP